MGASGSGKSTLLGLLAGLDTPTAGKVIIDGVDITGLNEDALALVRGRKIGFVFQSYQLDPYADRGRVTCFCRTNSPAATLRQGLTRARELPHKRRPRRPYGSLPGAAFGRRAAARGAGPRLYVQASHPHGRRTHRKSGQCQWRPRAGSADLIEPARGHHVGAGDSRSARSRIAGRPHRYSGERPGQVVADEMQPAGAMRQ